MSSHEIVVDNTLVQARKPLSVGVRRCVHLSSQYRVDEVYILLLIEACTYVMHPGALFN